MEFIYTKHPKDDDKIIKAISREEEMQRNQGKWICNNRIHRNKKKYNRNNNKRELRLNLNSLSLFTLILPCHPFSCFSLGPSIGTVPLLWTSLKD